MPPPSLREPGLPAQRTGHAPRTWARRVGSGARGWRDQGPAASRHTTDGSGLVGFRLNTPKLTRIQSTGAKYIGLAFCGEQRSVLKKRDTIAGCSWRALEATVIIALIIATPSAG